MVGEGGGEAVAVGEGEAEGDSARMIVHLFSHGDISSSLFLLSPQDPILTAEVSSSPGLEPFLLSY